MEPDTPILELEAVSKSYRTKGALFGWRPERRVTALHGVSLGVRQKEIFGLVGESGSGKTTAGRLIVKLETAGSGSIRLGGRDITELRGSEMKSYRRRVQMIFQDPYQAVNPQLSIYESVAEPLLIHGLAKGEERQDRVMDMLETVGLSPAEAHMNRYPHQLSGGQRQRVAIARAMVLEPDFLVADEPTSMLDASYSAKIFNILLEMRKRFGVSMLFITHSLAAARYLCDRIGVIYRGVLMEVGPTTAVIGSPIHPYTQALIDALPRFGRSGSRKQYGTLLEKEREAPGQVGCPFFERCAKAGSPRCSLDIPGLASVSPERRVACFQMEGAASGEGS